MAASIAFSTPAFHFPDWLNEPCAAQHSAAHLGIFPDWTFSRPDRE
jgi:hypothetical protein